MAIGADERWPLYTVDKDVITGVESPDTWYDK
jgi:hypothetical protein